MKIFFRVDSSHTMGVGHLMRCLSLAQELRRRGAEITFICRELPGNVTHLVQSAQFPVSFLSYEDNALKQTWEQDAALTTEILHNAGKVDWMIVDHYTLDQRWESTIKQYAKRVMVIDDLADRKHECDCLLDQNFYENMEQRYQGLVPNSCQKWLGPSYALLRPEFSNLRAQLKKNNSIVERAIIFFGGTDPSNETARAITAIEQLNMPHIKVDVVVGASNPNKQMIADRCEKMPAFKYHCQVNDIAQLFFQADIAIGAGGVTAWERCCLGLPSLVISIAENQEQLSIDANKKNILCYLGKSAAVDITMLSNALRTLINDSSLRMTMRANAINLVDGLGCNRIAVQMMS